jgi:hypothetical protein
VVEFAEEYCNIATGRKVDYNPLLKKGSASGIITLRFEIVSCYYPRICLCGTDLVKLTL